MGCTTYSGLTFTFTACFNSLEDLCRHPPFDMDGGFVPRIRTPSMLDCMARCLWAH